MNTAAAALGAAHHGLFFLQALSKDQKS